MVTHRPPTTSCSVNSHRPPIDTWGKIRIRPDGPYLRLPDFFREHTPAPDIYLGGQYGPSPTPRFRILSVAVSEWTPDMTNARPAHDVCWFGGVVTHLRGAIVPPDVREDIAPLNSILERGYRY